MKTKLFNLFAASFAVLSLAAGCQEKPVSEENLVEDASITVTPNKVEATWEEGVYAVSVESNCEEYGAMLIFVTIKISLQIIIIIFMHYRIVYGSIRNFQPKNIIGVDFA